MKINQDLKDLQDNSANELVFNYLLEKSAHSDVVEALNAAVAPLGDVQINCPDINKYRYFAISTNNIIFSFAYGMNSIAFRLNPLFKSRALLTGGFDIPELVPFWIFFKIFRDDWPSVDLAFWARKAYVFAREETII